MKADEQQQAWVFHFFVESAENELVPFALAEAFLDDIIQAAEARGLQIGGGFRPPTDEENNVDALGKPASGSMRWRKSTVPP